MTSVGPVNTVAGSAASPSPSHPETAAFLGGYQQSHHQLLHRISLNFQFGPLATGPSWLVWFGAGILMLFLLLGVIVIDTYYRKQPALNILDQDFISSLTHELRSPLTSMRLYLETLRLTARGAARRNRAYPTAALCPDDLIQALDHLSKLLRCRSAETLPHPLDS